MKTAIKFPVVNVNVLSAQRSFVHGASQNIVFLCVRFMLSAFALEHHRSLISILAPKIKPPECAFLLIDSRCGGGMRKAPLKSRINIDKRAQSFIMTSDELFVPIKSILWVSGDECEGDMPSRQIDRKSSRNSINRNRFCGVRILF